MPTFRYKASSQTGERKTGVLEAVDAPTARLELRGLDLQLLDLRRVQVRKSTHTAETPSVLQRWQRSRRADSRGAVFEGLSVLVSSGLPLRRALVVLAQDRRVPAKIRHLTLALEHDIASGKSFDSSIESRLSWFDTFDAAIIRAGMRQGQLAPALERLASRHTDSSAFRTKLIGAMSYPILVLLIATVVTAILGTQTLPPIAGMLQGADIAVPGLTRAVMRIGMWLSNGVAIGIVLTAAIFILTTAVLVSRWQSSRIAPGFFARHVPSLLVMPMLASLARSVADLTATGVPLIEALRIASSTIRGPCSSHLRQTVTGVVDRIEQGEELSDAFDDGVWFDPAFHRLLSIGQDAGELPTMLRRLADRYDQQADRAVERLSSYMEPAGILLMSVIVGLVVLAAVLPLIRLQELI
ncbi:MAG: type II secretion system F family protein [Planctomycetota bacterium]